MLHWSRLEAAVSHHTDGTDSALYTAVVVCVVRVEKQWRCYL